VVGLDFFYDPLACLWEGFFKLARSWISLRDASPPPLSLFLILLNPPLEVPRLLSATSTTLFSSIPPGLSTGFVSFP